MPAATKTVPPIEVANCAPPNEDYSYFEGRREHPFVPDAEGFDAVNAWWLAEASLLAYADTEFAEARFREAGFDEISHFSGKVTQVYVAHHADFIVVAFSGSDMRHRGDTETTSDVVRDWTANLNAVMVECEGGGRVHRGFSDALDEVWDAGEGRDLDVYLDSICDAGRKKVWFTGHSLGGALATLAAGRYECEAEVYTFGAPRVGDEEYVESLQWDVHRFVNGDDIVCKVPLFATSYRHVGEVHLLGESDDEEEVESDNSGGLLRRVADAAEAVVLSAKEKFVRGIPTSQLTDHAPIFYAVLVWNEYVVEGRHESETD